ncbi:hypothetical protein BX600DRAFT_549600 [Xylariales sp. PMI_506]|nr:hypothetical protein BX600DRAFT_549600 [Xylariales sp. PMI_506]
MFYLGGGGSEADESQLWDMVFHPGQRITVWPYAMPPDRAPKSVAWVKSALAARSDGFTVREGEEHGPDPEASCYGLLGEGLTDVLVIPGGNTFHLLAWIDARPALRPALRAFLDRGGAIYGGSAGAIVQGSDISIADVRVGGLDVNDIELADTRGLDLLPGRAAVYSHFEFESAAQQDACQRWADEHGVPVVGTPEKGGVAVLASDGMVNVGPATIRVFRPHAPSVDYVAGERVACLSEL